MARSTGPILAAAGLVMGNEVLVHGKVPDYRIPVAAAIAAGMLALLEKASPGVAVGLAYTSLVAVIFVRVDATTPTPAESMLKYLGYGGK